MKRRKFRRWIPGILGLVMLVLFSLQFLFFFFGEEILKKSILVAFSQYVNARYPGASPQPVLDFDNLSLNLLRGSFTVTELNLKSDSKPSPNPDEPDNYFEVLIPELKVEGINFWLVYQKKILKVEEIRVGKPLLQVTYESHIRKDNMQKEDVNYLVNRATQNLYETVSTYLNIFSFKKLQVEDATVAVYKTDSIGSRIDNFSRSRSYYFADHLHITLSDFYLDSAARYDTERILFTKNIETKISNYKVLLPDSSYLFSIDTLAFSTAGQRLYLQQMEIIPQKAAHPGQGQYFHIKVPEVTMTQVDLQEIYFDSLLEVNELTFAEPLIQVYGNFDRKNSAQISSLGLRKLHPDSLQAFMPSQLLHLSINYFKLYKGQLNIFDMKNEGARLLNIRNLELSFNDFYLDSMINRTGVDSLSNILPMDSILLELADLEMYMPDRVHRLTSSLVSLKTDRQSQYHCNISFDSIFVKPETDSLVGLFERLQVPDLGYKISIEKVLLYDIDLEELSERKLVYLDSMAFKNPQVRIANFSGVPFSKLADETKRQDTTQEKSVKEILYAWSQARLDFHPVIAPGRNTALFYGVYVNHIKIDSGRMILEEADKITHTFEEIALLGNFSADISQARIDNMGGHILTMRKGYRDSRVAVHVSDVNLNLERGIFHLPRDGGPTSDGVLQFAEASISSASSEGYVKRLYIWPNQQAIAGDRNQIRNLFFPYIKLSGFDFYSLYNLQQADVRRLHIFSPRIKLAIDEHQSSQVSGQSEINMETLFQWIKPFLNSLSLQKLDLQDAVLEVEKRESGQADYHKFFMAEKLNLNVFKFFMDSTTHMTWRRPLYVGDARLEVKNYQFNFASKKTSDMICLKGKILTFSTYNNQMRIKGLKINPGADTDERHYNLQVAEIELNQINLYEYLKYNRLSLKHIRIWQPKGKIWIKSHDVNTAEDTYTGEREPLQPDLYPYIHDYIQKLVIENMLLEQGALEFVEIRRDTVHHIKADTISLSARNILVDPLIRRDNKMLYADQVDFSIHINDYFLKMEEAGQQLSVKNLFLSKAHAHILAEGIKLQPLKENPFKAPALLNSDVNRLYNISIPSLRIEGIDFEKAYLQGDWIIKDLIAILPEVRMYETDAIRKRTAKIPSFREMAGPYINSVRVDQFTFKNGKFSILRASGDSMPAFSAKKVDASLHKFYIDEQVYNKAREQKNTDSNITRRLLFAEDIAVKIKDYQLKLGDSLYVAKAAEINVTTRKPAIVIKSFRLEPRYGKYEINTRFPYRKTWASCQVPLIKVLNFDFEKLVDKGYFKADFISLEKPSLTIFNDKRLPKNLSRHPLLPQEMLLELNFPLAVDSIQVSEGFVSYGEQVTGAGRPGFLTFENLNAKLHHLTNDTALIRQNLMMSLQASTYLLGKGYLNATCHFAMNDPEMYFTAKGSLGAMDLTALNVMVEPAAFVHIKKGVANGLQFDFSGNSERSSGSMWFNYSDLSILLVDKETGIAGFDERVGSFFANAFVVKSDNPKAVFLRVGKISYKRDETRSVFHYWWQSLLSGIKSSIGLEKFGEKTKNFTVLDE